MNDVSKRLFIETTVHISRWFGTKRSKQLLRAQLRVCRLVTSAHVAAEYKRTLVRSLCVFHNLLVDSSSVGEALKRLARYQDRTLSRVVQVYGELVDQKIDDKNDLIDWCDAMIRDIAMARFHCGHPEIIDEIGCIKANAIATKSGGTWRIRALCNEREKPRCGVGQFADGRSGELKRVVDHLRANPGSIKRQETVLRELESVVAGGRPPFGRRCQAVADVLIAIESPGDSTIISEDSDYAALCVALGKESLRPT